MTGKLSSPNAPEAIAPDLWIVDSPPIRAMGVPMPVRMTVVRLPDGRLWLHSPTPCTDALAEAVAALGEVRHLVAPSLGHWMFLADWQARFPSAVTWAVPTLRRRPQVKLSGVRLDADLGDEPPPDWSGALRQVLVPGGVGFREAAFLHAPTRSLILTDLISNIETQGAPAATRLYARLAAPPASTPRHLRVALGRRREDACAAVRRILSWAPERVIFAHGRWFGPQDAHRLPDAFAWLLDEPRS